MHKLKKIIIFIGLFFAFLINVNAAVSCPYSEQSNLNHLVSNMKVINELDSELYEYPDLTDYRDFFNISVLNISKEFYVVITNNFNDEKVTLTYEDSKDDIVTYKWYETDYKATFNIKIYTSKETSCPDEVIKTFVTSTPRFNVYSLSSLCEELKDFTYCQEYVTFDELTEKEFQEKVERYKQGTIDKDGNETDENVKDDNAFIKFIKTYKWYIIGSIIILGSITGFIIYKVYKRNKKRKELIR